MSNKLELKQNLLGVIRLLTILVMIVRSIMNQIRVEFMKYEVSMALMVMSITLTIMSILIMI